MAEINFKLKNYSLKGRSHKSHISSLQFNPAFNNIMASACNLYHLY